MAERPRKRVERIVLRRPPEEMPSPDEFVLRLIQETMTGRKLDAIHREVRAQRRIAQLTSYIQTPPPSARMFPSPYRHAEVGPGESAVLFDLDIPGEYLGGVITHLGNSWFANTWLSLDVDHRPVLERKIERQIAPVTEPTELHRFLARRNIRWSVHNEDDTAHHFEVLCDGYFIPRAAVEG